MDAMEGGRIPILGDRSQSAGFSRWSAKNEPMPKSLVVTSTRGSAAALGREFSLERLLAKHHSSFLGP
jgi:hypothetical protein